jgi:two-component system, cell cycle response regulator
MCANAGVERWNVVDPKKIWSSSQLPTLPTIAMRLLELARDPETEFKDVIGVVKTDPAITAKILKAANSSFFGFKSPVASIERAVPLLGTTVVTTLALSFSLVDAAMTSGSLAQHYTAYWKHSIVQAVAAEVLAERVAKGLAGDCFLTGLLLDLGRLAMLKTVPNDYLPVLEEWQEQGGSLKEREAARLGIDHVRVGAQLMREWKLPHQLIAAVTMHHATVAKLLEELKDPTMVADRVVAIAATVGDYFCSTTKGAALERLESLSSEFFQMDQAALLEYFDRTRDRIDRAGSLFCVSFEGLGTSADLMGEASEQLARVAVREHMASTQMEIQRQAAEKANHELESRNQQLAERVTRDGLTGLYNRAFFAESLTSAINAASRSAAPIGIVFCDIDHFKQLNDTYGHPFGDEVLRSVAQIFSEVLRKSDVVARYGGEEFVVLVHQPTEKGLEKLSERLRRAIEAAPFWFEGKQVRVTISVGAAIVLPERDPGDLALRLVAAADEAMYESKQNGRNQAHVRSLIDKDDQHLAQLVAQKRFSRWLVQNQIFDIQIVSRALLETPAERLKVGSLAQLLGLLTSAQIDDIRRRQHATADRFGRCAISLGHLTEDQLATILAIQAEPPNLLARTLTIMGLVDKAKADALLTRYRSTLSASEQTIAALV